jgi:hypothetical protein
MLTLKSIRCMYGRTYQVALMDAVGIDIQTICEFIEARPNEARVVTTPERVLDGADAEAIRAALEAFDRARMNGRRGGA